VQMVFERTLRDHIPCMPYKYATSAYWWVSQELKERMMAKSREVGKEYEARRLETQFIGTPVAIQNQSGRYPNKWVKTEVIMEVKTHEQIVIQVDESGKLTLRTGDSYANWILERPV
jgi:hypothetical protein